MGTAPPLPIAGSLCHTALRSAHRGNRLVRVRGAEAMSAAKVKSAALSVTHKCRVLLASNISYRSAPLLLATGVLVLTSLAPGFAEHLGRRLGSPPQHCHGRRQGKVRRLVSYHFICVFVRIRSGTVTAVCLDWFLLGCSWAARIIFTRRGCTT